MFGAKNEDAQLVGVHMLCGIGALCTDLFCVMGEWSKRATAGAHCQSAKVTEKSRLHTLFSFIS